MHMDASFAVRGDFDRIASLEVTDRDSNVHYHASLLQHLPIRMARALDVGCGAGAFARAPAERADHVLAIDLSPRMIERARERSAQHSNIEYRVADLLADDLGAEPFDCIATIATIHHMPLAPALERMRRALAPGGTPALLRISCARKAWWTVSVTRSPFRCRPCCAPRIPDGRSSGTKCGRRGPNTHATHATSRSAKPPPR